MDPVGLAMENFDTIGGFRSVENGAPIDASGELDTVKFTDVAGMGKAVHDNPAATGLHRQPGLRLRRGPCAQQVRGRLGQRHAGQGFQQRSGYKFTDLLKDVATSDVFYRASAPQTGSLDTPRAKLASDVNGNQEVQK